MLNFKGKLIIGVCFLLLLIFSLQTYFDLFRLSGTKVSMLKINNDTNLSNWVPHIIGKPDRQQSTLDVGDLDGDGDTDIIIALGKRENPQPSDGLYWYQAPYWNFRRLSDPALPIRWSLSLTSGDVDNDGDLDIVALSFDLSKVYLAINPGDERVTGIWKTLVIKDATSRHRDGERVELTDIDGDGFLDVLFPRGKPKEVWVLFNPSGKVHREWEEKLIGTHAGSDAHDVLPSDLDNDGDLDIVTASGDGTPGRGVVYWYEHPDKHPRLGAWKRHKVSFFSTNFAGLQIDDIDKDGWQDIFVTQSHGNPGDVMWYKNPGDSRKKWQRLLIDVQYAPHAALAFDADGDGIKEFWVPDSGCCNSDKKGGIVIYKPINATKNEWKKYEVAAAPQFCRQSRAADIDLDGDLDVVCEAANNNLPEPRNRELLWWENVNDF